MLLQEIARNSRCLFFPIYLKIDVIYGLFWLFFVSPTTFNHSFLTLAFLKGLLQISMKLCPEFSVSNEEYKKRAYLSLYR